MRWVKRTQPAAVCMKCGRTVALLAKQAKAFAEIEYKGSSVATTTLRPHKCSHGDWCDECQERRH